jgi:hypothetical protein
VTPYMEALVEGCEQALQLCRNAAERPDIDITEHKAEMALMEKAYHYAQRYLPLFVGANAKQRHSIELAFEIILEIVREGYDGLAYSSREKRYRSFREASRPGSAKGFDKTFTWDRNPWMIIHCADKLASGIRRVKATSVLDVHQRLFV